MGIYESDNWVVEINNEGNVVVSYLLEGHYKNEIVLDVKDGVKVVRSDDKA